MRACARWAAQAREQQGLHEAISSVKGGVKGASHAQVWGRRTLFTAAPPLGADEQAALWESVSTVSCRISDMQKFIDDLR